MFGKIAGFEFRYQMRQPVFWVVAILFFLLTFASMVVEQVRIGSGGNVLRNSAFAISQVHLILSLFYMFVTTAFVANVITRDVETGFGPIVHATRMSKFDYLYGRFTGAFLACAVSFLAVPLAMFAGTFMPWVDRETLGPNVWQYYAYAYFWIALPSIFLTSAIFFTVSTITRSMMGTYVSVVALLVAYFALSVSLDKPEFRHVMAYAEPFGAAAYGEATRYWTAVERNTQLPEFKDAMLWGRLMWIGISMGILGLAYAFFRVEARGAKAKKAEKLKALVEKTAPAARAVGPLPKPVYDGATAWAQLWARTKFEMAQVFLSPAYFVLLALGLFNSVASLWFANEIFGTPLLPVTRVVIETLNGAFGLIPIIIAIYYSGELVWRERDRRTAEIVDSSAVPDWAFIMPKTLAIALVLFSTLAISVATGIGIQAIKGYDNFELVHYLTWYVLPQTFDWTLIAILAVFFQVMSPHKFIGWGLMVIYFITTVTLGNIGFDHGLYNFGGGPNVPLSDMNGQGHFWIAATWFRVYWGAFSVLLLVLGYGLWRRGTETRLAPRLARLPRRMKGAPGLIALVALLVFAGSGVFIFLNTNVWNEYRNNEFEEQFQADYEKVLLPYEKVPQPQITAVTLNLDLYPHAPRLVTRGTYEIKNETDKPIGEVHLRADPDTKFIQLSVTGGRLKKEYKRFNYRIYALDTPMQPGETRTVTFETLVEQRGFKNRGNMVRIVDNGTFISNNEFAPLVGMDRSAMIQDRAKRRKHGLDPDKVRPPKLGQPGADQFNYLRNDSGFVRADITLTTDADQVPIAPGEERSNVVRNGRRTAHFVSEAPILNFFSVQSARYAIRSRDHNGVKISVFYNPEHARNVDRMLHAGELSLDYYQANFSPYQFRQVRFIEFPNFTGQFAQSFANTIPWSEGLGFIADVSDPEKIDYVTYVAAHEIAHQWWAHQIIGANEQGMTTLSETLAQYSALMVMEHLYGPDKIRQFLKFELDNYLRSRGSDLIGEQPLGQNENQPYIHYRKGSLVMYLLKDQLGEAKVNAALRSLLAKFAFHDAPYPTSRDLVAALREQAGDNAEQQALITDLFEKITIYDLKVTAAPKAHKRADGRWDVTVTVSARKLYATDKGKETEAPLDEVFDIGLFTAEPGKGNFDHRNVVMLRRMPLKTGVQTLTFTVDREPTWVGVDPYNKRIDRNSDDNLMKVGS